MKNFLLFIFFSSVLLGCAGEEPTQFSEEALNDVFIDTSGNEISFGEILDKNQGKLILIDVWASWCRDCIVGIPELKNFQKSYKDVSYVFLSLDRSMDSWKTALQTYQLDGQHYYIQSGWDGAFAEFIDLDWIPRYLLIDKNGTISQYQSIRIKDVNLIKKIEQN